MLVNSNPATIMTDNAMADEVYIEPADPPDHKENNRKGAPGQPSLDPRRGQTGLTLSMQLAKEGFLDKMGVKLLGANPETIDKAEDRQSFKDTMLKIGQPVIPSVVVNDLESAMAFAHSNGYPLIIRPRSRSAAPAAASPRARRSSSKSRRTVSDPRLSTRYSSRSA